MNGGGCVITRPAPLTLKEPCQGFSLLSDLHIGAPQVDYKQIDRELADAADNGDRILINGDVLDLILAKDAKRYDPDAIHKRLRGVRSTINAAVEWAVEILAPYALSIDVIGCGNHEAAVERHHSFDPILSIVNELSRVAGRRIAHGGYHGFVDYRLRYGGPDRGRRFVVWYYHGNGHGGPNTAMNDFARRSWVEGADVMWLGHKHCRLAANPQRLSCPYRGTEPTVRDVRQVMTGAYFDTYQGQTQASIRRRGRRSNYAADAAMAPQGKGGARVVVQWSSMHSSTQIKVIQ